MHDELADIMSRKLIEGKYFENVYKSSTVPSFPRPDFVFISRSKEPSPPVAFEFKPPNENKREYITGLGQAVAYLNNFPISFLIIPQQRIDEIYLPEYFSKTIDVNDLLTGLISYDPKSLEPKIEVPGKENKKIDVKKVSKEMEAVRSWAYWRETTPSELYGMLDTSYEIFRAEEPNKISKDLTMNTIWDKVLKEKYSESSKTSYLLNYQLLMDHLNLWDADSRLIVLGNRLREIGLSFGWDSKEFTDAISLTLLTEGGHFTLLKNMHEIQSLYPFARKGDFSELSESWTKIEKEHLPGVEEKELLNAFLSEGDEWLRVMSAELYRRGFGRSVIQLIDELSRFFPRLHNVFKTDFLLTDRFIKGKGFPISVARIASILENKNRIMNVIII